MKNKLSLRALAIFVGCGVGCCGSGWSQSSTSSAPIGFYRLDLNAGYQTVGVSVINAPLFASWVGSSGPGTLTASGVPVDLGGLLVGGKSYFVEIVAGPTGTADVHVGHRFEVDVNTTIAAATADGVIALDLASGRGTRATLPALAGYRFELRAHMTLAQVFDPATLHGSANFAVADQVQVFDGSGFSVYYVLGDNSSFAQWTKVADNQFASRDDLAIMPGQGLIFKRSASSAGPVTMRVEGMARTTPFVQPLNAGFNFVAEGFPASNSFDGRNAYPGAFADADRAQVYNGSGFETYRLYSDGAENNLWVKVGSFDSQNASQVFDYRGAVFVDVAAASSDYRIEPPYGP